jgi:hypothetical protein
MPEMDLSSLNRPEVRRLLAAAEARQNHALAAQLRAELAGRGAQARPLPVQPIEIVTGSFDGAWGNEPGEADADAAEVRRRRIGATVLGAGAAAMVAMVVGWQLARPEPSAPAPPPPATTAPVSLSAPPARPPAPVTTPEPPAPRAAATPAARPKPAQAERRKAATRPVSASARRSAQDRRMLRAYNRARAAGVDRLTLDRGQARFRAMLARSHKPGQAEQLYAKRIRELEAQARRRR